MRITTTCDCGSYLEIECEKNEDPINIINNFNITHKHCIKQGKEINCLNGNMPEADFIEGINCHDVVYHKNEKNQKYEVIALLRGKDGVPTLFDIRSIEKNKEINPVTIAKCMPEDISYIPFPEYTDEDIEYLRKWKNDDYPFSEHANTNGYSVIFLGNQGGLFTYKSVGGFNRIKSFGKLSQEELVKLAKELC